MLTPELKVLLVFLTSLISAVFLIPKLARIATRIGLVDQPNLRKMHERPLPLVGGLAMVIAATFSSLLFIPIKGLRGLFLGTAILFLIGFLDDYREIGHREKFFAQILATSMMFYLSKTYLITFGDLLGLGEISLPDNVYVLWIVTVFCVVGVINAVNFIDGLDGLAGGISFLAFLTFAIHSSLIGNTTIMLLNIALLGAVAGFLRFNWPPAKIFMGDAGSLCLGFSLAFMALILTQGEDAQVKPVIALLILAVPIVDTLVVMSKRIVRRESPFKPDKYHLHHVFVRQGMSKEWSVKVILMITAAFCVVSLVGVVYSLSERLLFGIFVLYFCSYVFSSFYAIYLMRLGERISDIKSKQLFIPRFIEKLNVDGVAGRLNLKRFIRKSSRYNVDLQVECFDRGTEAEYRGKVLNISNGGVMVDMPDLRTILQESMLRISFVVDEHRHVIELPAKHIWITPYEKACYHGFEFLDFDGNQKDVIFRLLVNSKSNL